MGSHLLAGNLSANEQSVFVACRIFPVDLQMPFFKLLSCTSGGGNYGFSRNYGHVSFVQRGTFHNSVGGFAQSAQTDVESKRKGNGETKNQFE